MSVRNYASNSIKHDQADQSVLSHTDKDIWHPIIMDLRQALSLKHNPAWWTWVGPDRRQTVPVACWNSVLIESAPLLFHESHLFPSFSEKWEWGSKNRNMGEAMI